jgi:hypothetical protein
MNRLVKPLCSCTRANNPRPVRVGFVVDRVTMGQVLSRRISVFSFHLHSINSPYPLSSVLRPLYKRGSFSSSKYSSFHNSNVFGSCIIHILYPECAKIKKKNNSGSKRLTTFSHMSQITTRVMWRPSTSNITHIGHTLCRTVTGRLGRNSRCADGRYSESDGHSTKGRVVVNVSQTDGRGLHIRLSSFIY